MVREREKGFSLIELLIVVAIILVIAAIAIPNMMRSRIAANEAAAVSAVRAITTAEHAYAQSYPEYGFTCSLGELGPPPSGQPFSTAAAGILDPVVSLGAKSGYSFAIIGCGSTTPRYSFQSTGVPKVVGQTGQRAFCSDNSGVIYFSDDGVAATCFSTKTILQ
jgi:prepilin-type N-terminal cleavage/methylation domain-containing protein